MTDDRAVSTALGYVLILSITAILVSGLLIAGGNFVTDQRQSTVRTELDVLGQRLAAGISTADYLAETTGGGGEVRVEVPLPGRVAGSDYGVSVRSVEGDTDSYVLELSTNEPDVTVAVHAVSRTTLTTPAELDGGSVVVVWNETTGELEVTDG